MSRAVNGQKTAEKSYKYAYDPVNRMTDALYYEKATGGSWTATGAFDEKGVSYDENGNIKTLTRMGLVGGVVKKIDSLNYHYNPDDNNKLKWVTDGSSSIFKDNDFKNLANNTDTTQYDYDDNGNLIKDLKKGITEHYNILNRVDSIRVTAGTNQWITYTYDATGTLLRKTQYKTSSTVPVMVTDYIDGFVFENNTLSYFAAAEGRVRVNSGTLINEYVITDIQGNSRVSFEDNGSGVAVVRQENSYYPFGLIMGNGVTPATQPNKNLYNGGSEWQNDYSNDLPDYYQTFYRNYDAAIGRFVGVDPMADAADSWTPYQYALNNPGMLNDPMGNLTTAEFHKILGTLLNSEYGGHWAGNDAGNIYEYGDNATGFLFGAQGFSSNGSWGANEGWANNISEALGRYNENKEVTATDKIYWSPQRFYQTTAWYHDTNGNPYEVNGISSTVQVFDFGTLDSRRAAYNDMLRHNDYVNSHIELAKRHDLSELVVESAKWYAGGEFFEAAIAGYRLYQASSVAVPSLVKALRSTVGAKVEQYALRAMDDGFYPVMKRGFADAQELVWLNKGDVWKFGTTKNPLTRYTASYLSGIGEFGVQYTTEFAGSLKEALQVERMKILNYIDQTGFLPAGNKMIK